METLPAEIISIYWNPDILNCCCEMKLVRLSLAHLVSGLILAGFRTGGPRRA
jgi:hypothetical protein